MFKLRREDVVDIVRCGLCKVLVEDGNECRGLSEDRDDHNPKKQYDLEQEETDL